MSDTQTAEAETTEAAASGATAATEKAPKPDTTKPCFCSAWQVTDLSDPSGDSTWTTGCQQTTKRQFAQGHDAKFVSFVTDGHFDGYAIQRIKDGTTLTYASPVEAAETASEALKAKAQAAVANRQAKEDAKQTKAQERAAAKARKAAEKEAAAERKAAEKAAAAEAKNAPRAVPVQVAEGSQEGDAPARGARTDAKIKVGRYTYEGVTIDEEGNATFLHEKSGEEQTVPLDGYRLLG